MDRPFREVSLGGTFHAMHAGHRDYIGLAAKLADRLHLHLTSDELAAWLKSYDVRSAKERLARIKTYLESIEAARRTEFYVVSSQSEVAENVVNRATLDVALVEPRYLELFQFLNEERGAKGFVEYCILLKPRTRIGGRELSSSEIEESGEVE